VGLLGHKAAAAPLLLRSMEGQERHGSIPSDTDEALLLLAAAIESILVFKTSYNTYEIDGSPTTTIDPRQ